MSEPTTKAPTPQPALRRWRRRLFAILAVVGLASAWWAYSAAMDYFQGPPGPAQPIPFSHRFHVTTKQISCIMCHNGVVNTDRAGVPPLETCMLCHKRIIVDYPWIRQLREHYDRGLPVKWVHVNNRVPEFVYFSHQRHVRAGFDCGKCHGDVAQTDRLYVRDQFEMGFCVQCHRDNNYSHDCLTCHR